MALLALRTGGETLTAVGVFLASAALLAALGYRIRVHEDTRLVSGYDPRTVTDEAAVTRLVGTVTLAIAGLTALYGVGLLLFEPDLMFWGSYVSLLVAALVVVQLRGRRHRSG